VPGSSARWRSKCCFRDNATEQFPAEAESISAMTIGEESEMPDAHEAFGQDMQEEAA